MRLNRKTRKILTAQVEKKPVFLRAFLCAQKYKQKTPLFLLRTARRFLPGKYRLRGAKTVFNLSQ